MKNVKNFKCFYTAAVAYLWTMAAMNHAPVCADTATNWTQINEICGVSYSDRIIGGINARLGQYPWIAQIGIRSKATKSFIVVVSIRSPIAATLNNI